MNKIGIILPRLRRWAGWAPFGSRILFGLVAFLEGLAKRTVFGCQMCGQCVLSYKGMTCPMRCPKNLRNGPCGGVRDGDRCEVYPDRPCVHVLGWKRAGALGTKRRWLLLQPIIDRRLTGTSSWLNHLLGRDAGVYGPLHQQLNSPDSRL